MILILLMMVSVATNAFRESEQQTSILATQDMMGVLDWCGCDKYTNMRIVGTRSLCFKANPVAHHCFSVLDVEDTDNDENGVGPSMAPEESGDEPGDADVNVNVTENWRGKDLLMLDPWELKWVPVRIREVTNDGISLRHFSSYWKWYRVSRSTRFKTFRPKSILLELTGESKCLRADGKKQFHVAKVHCVASPMKLDVENMEYAKVISDVGATKDPAKENKPFVEAGQTLGAYSDWKDYDTPLPATVGGLKTWSEKYLHGYPEYKTMTYNCQQFEVGSTRQSQEKRVL